MTKPIFLTGLAVVALVALTFSPISHALADSLKSDREIVQSVDEIMQQMSPQQQQAVLEQAKMIEQKLKKMSAQERQEVINTVRNVGSSLDYQNVNMQTLEKQQPQGLDQTMENLEAYQDNF